MNSFARVFLWLILTVLTEKILLQFLMFLDKRLARMQFLLFSIILESIFTIAYLDYRIQKFWSYEWQHIENNFVLYNNDWKVTETSYIYFFHNISGLIPGILIELSSNGLQKATNKQTHNTTNFRKFELKKTTLQLIA